MSGRPQHESTARVLGQGIIKSSSTAFLSGKSRQRVGGGIPSGKGKQSTSATVNQKTQSRRAPPSLSELDKDAEIEWGWPSAPKKNEESNFSDKTDRFFWHLILVS